MEFEFQHVLDVLTANQGIMSCGIEALSNLAPHLKPLHMLAPWGRLWSGLQGMEWVNISHG